MLQTIQSPILALKPPIRSTPLNTSPKLHADTHKTSNLSPKRQKMQAQNLTRGYIYIWRSIYIYIHTYIHMCVYFCSGQVTLLTQKSKIEALQNFTNLTRNSLKESFFPQQHCPTTHKGAPKQMVSKMANSGDFQTSNFGKCTSNFGTLSGGSLAPKKVSN